jgi:streptomycin 6-kinase
LNFVDDRFNNSGVDLRFRECVLAWQIRVQQVVHTPHSVIAFGDRAGQPIVLKVVKSPGEEWLSGQMLEAFGGRGMVRPLEHAGGAVLLERILPGTHLADDRMSDDQATEVIAAVIGQMAPGSRPDNTPTVASWVRSFERYTASGADLIPTSLVEAAQGTYLELCSSQGASRLLHGDLHHHNVLLDSQRGWLAIDPKGIDGELAYEVGAALRNPCERPEIFAAPHTIVKRVNCFSRELCLDSGRILGWAFAQAVLAAIWEWEDDGVLTAGAGWIALANAVRPMLKDNTGR